MQLRALFDVSSGHAGLVISLLGHVVDAHEASFRQDYIAEISAEAFTRYISDTSALFTNLHSRAVGRSMFTADKHNGVQIGHRDLVKRILERGPVIYDSKDDNHTFVYQHGICQGHMERVRWHGSKPQEILSVVKMTPGSGGGYSMDGDENTWEGERTILVFPTEIHAQ